MDELAGDLAEGTDFLHPAEWEISPTCDIAPNARVEVGDGSKPIYFDCANLNIQPGAVLFVDPHQYVVVRGYVSVAGTLEFNVDNSVDLADDHPNNEDDAVLVIRGKTTGNPGIGLSASGTRININNTYTYLHTGALDINADEVRWVAPQTEGYTTVTDADGNKTEVVSGCDETQDMMDATAATYVLPTPPCFQNLALWSNNTRVHRMRGGANLEVIGIVFTPYAGRVSGAFDLAGGSSQRLTKAQFFTYRFDMSGSSTLSMRPDPTTFIPTKIIGGTSLIR
jgi:hypothetical protein